MRNYPILFGKLNQTICILAPRWLLYFHPWAVSVVNYFFANQQLLYNQIFRIFWINSFSLLPRDSNKRFKHCEAVGFIMMGNITVLDTLPHHTPTVVCYSSLIYTSDFCICKIKELTELYLFIYSCSFVLLKSKIRGVDCDCKNDWCLFVYINLTSHLLNFTCLKTVHNPICLVTVMVWNDTLCLQFVASCYPSDIHLKIAAYQFCLMMQVRVSHSS